MDIEKKRARIAKVAGRNGWSVVVLGGLCLAGSLLEFSVAGILVCLAALASGCMELSGRRRLKQNRPEAGRWLAGSQLLLLVAVILYSVSQLLLLDPNEIMMHLSDLRQAMDPNDLKKLIVRVIHILYPLVIAGTVLFQGGLWLYYTRATRKLEQAAAEESQGKMKT
ncbi:MAG: hypothetical protein ABSA67_16375 [Candidatus Brocadiia bacterium]|jgi:hypothetical protein